MVASTMKDSERIAAEYLRSCGYTDIEHEPDGNVPPDFLIERNIAIEVRRLNQNIITKDERVRGLEETFIPLLQRIKRYLPTLGSSEAGESWFVCFDMGRPLEEWQQIEQNLRYELLAFKSSLSRTPRNIQITEHLSIELFRSSNPHSSFFLLGAGSDEDSGGFIISEVRQNLELCIADKERKIAPFRHKYEKWWLLLVDHIGHALDSEDQRQFRVLPNIKHNWDKIILINPLNPTHAFEI